MGRLRAILSRTRQTAATGDATTRQQVRDVLHEDATATAHATPPARLESSIHAGYSPVASDLLHVARPGGCNMQQPAADCTPAFSFTPPVDPEAEREALEERAGIIAEGCGIDQATALREARLCIGRARAWSTFIANVGRILAAPEADQASAARPLPNRSCSEVRRRDGPDDGRGDAELDRCAEAIRRRLKPELRPLGCAAAPAEPVRPAAPGRNQPGRRLGRAVAMHPGTGNGE